MAKIKYLIIFVALINTSQSWLECSDQAFCSTIRNSPGTPKFQLDEASISQTPTTLKANLINTQTQQTLSFVLTSLSGGTFRVEIDDPKDPRHSVPEALDGVPKRSNMKISRGLGRILVGNGGSTADIVPYPFTITVSTPSGSVIINGGQKMEFNSQTNDKSIALDFKIPGSTVAYGIPERAERLALKSNVGREPYRMFNLDNPGYLIETTEPLYGAIPVLYAHSAQHTAGIFWLTSSQTFFDLNNSTGDMDALIISQSGKIDLFVLSGPTLKDTVKQYHILTGTANLPPLFSMGYHQSRWSYLTQQEAEFVVSQFNPNDFPLDVLWLDVDYTDGKKYFTWNYTAYPDPTAMQMYILSLGRKLVLIIDPHVKVETGYRIYDELIQNKYYVNSPDGQTPYTGVCWPGISNWVDFTNPKARDWYAMQYSFQNFGNTTPIVHIWNDMNEPSVFDVDEKTMPDDAVYYDGWLHLDVHNIYGFMHTMATHAGLLKRSPTQRPFVLTRSHFAGAQRYTAIWTGDNNANWEHLAIGIPICVTEALAGISFCGADVGGFNGEPTEELIQRWYQLGSWLPFFREHSADGTNHREPYLYPDYVQVRLRAAMKTRYAHLPYWYTLWYEHTRNLEPVIRPISYDYPTETAAFTVDSDFLVGPNILVAAVIKPLATSRSVYLPGTVTQVWYETQENKVYFGNGFNTLSVTLDSVPVFYRGGSIIPRKDISRTATTYMVDDPYTLYVFLDIYSSAIGTLYVDDYETFNYKDKLYEYIEIKYEANILTTRKIDTDATYPIPLPLNDTIIYNPAGSRKFTRAHLTEKDGKKRSLELTYGENDIYFKISNLNVDLKEAIKIEFY